MLETAATQERRVPGNRDDCGRNTIDSDDPLDPSRTDLHIKRRLPIRGALPLEAAGRKPSGSKPKIPLEVRSVPRTAPIIS